jgi:hypothetical protein
MIWAEHVACMEKKNAYRLFDDKTWGTIDKDNIIIDAKRSKIREYEPDLSGLG